MKAKIYRVLDTCDNTWVQVEAFNPAQAVQVASTMTIGRLRTMEQQVIFGFCKVECGSFVLYL